MAESREFYIDPSGALAFAEMMYRDEDDEWGWWQDMEAELEPFGLKAEPTVAEASFYVNVRVDVFAGWLLFYTSPDIVMSWPGADDSRVYTSFSLEVAVPTKRAAGLEPILAIVHGNLFLSSKEKQGPPTVQVDLEKIGEIEIIPLESDRSEVIITNWIKECQEIFDWLLEEIIERWPEAGKQTTRKRGRQAETLAVGENRPEPPKRSKHGATVRTQEYGAVFKRLKDANPRWTQYKVAQEASDELGEHITADTVRNAYRALGWKWERADRIR